MKKNIKIIVMDVDGTLTDGMIYVSAHGELMKAFNIKDGYAIAHVREYGIEPVIITGRESEIVKQRCKELGITKLYQNVSNKLFCLKGICGNLGISLDQVAYIGDDINDLICMQQCGISACPSDAVNIVKTNVTIVLNAKGGKGAVREFIDEITKNISIKPSYDDEFNLKELIFEDDPYIND